jgi:hypothetical protein
MLKQTQHIAFIYYCSMHDVRPININVMHARLIQTRALQTRKLYPTKDYDLYAERKYVHCFCSVVQFVQLSVIKL